MESGAEQAASALAAEVAAHAETRKERDAWRNLVAVVCGDGGHYHQQHGTEQTLQHCLERVCLMVADLDASQEEAARLRAIVDRLPKTKDGVPVIPGRDHVYHPDWNVNGLTAEVPGGGWAEESVEKVMTRLGLEEEPEYIVFGFYWESDTGYEEDGQWLVSECYSTRAAAEAAKGRPCG